SRLADRRDNAARAAPVDGNRCAFRFAASLARDGHLPDQDRTREDRRARIDVRSDRLRAHEDVAQVAGDGDFLLRIGYFAVLDPEAGRAARVIAGDDRYTLADQFG